MISRRHYIGALVTGAGLLRARIASAFGFESQDPHAMHRAAPAPTPTPSPKASPLGMAPGAPRTKGAYMPVVTPDGSTLPFTMNDGVKEFRIIADTFVREFAPGMSVNCWGYNGSTPGPTIEAVEGDRVRLFVTNKLPEHTTMHWHGICLLYTSPSPRDS